MKLRELNPKILDGRVLLFDCPLCRMHKIRFDFRTWAVENAGDFDAMTVRPSIAVVGDEHSCRWHGLITKGEVTTC